ncbi:MAG: hypothetical protein ABSH08_16610 [Tepidisphaeraceae bacterium]|jgi:hypothetical protein
MARSLLAIALAASTLGTTGCAAHPKPSQIPPPAAASDTLNLTLPRFDPDVMAVCDPPIGWIARPLRTAPNNVHQVWRSPTGDTAYGVVHFRMPLPVGGGLALSGFLAQMKKTEGTSKLLDRQDDPNLPGIRFVAEGTLHTLRANLILDGWEGWAVYAGTLRSRPINQKELDRAIAAREHTRVGKPHDSSLQP